MLRLKDPCLFKMCFYAELDELVNENNTISQHLNLPLSTNNVAINVNNFGNNLSTQIILILPAGGPGDEEHRLVFAIR